jgi:hypothetical protein
MSLQLRRILSDGGALRVAISDENVEIPLNNMARETRQLFASCP